MEFIEVARHIEAPADKVWYLVGTWDDTTLSQGYVDRVEVEGAGLGSIRNYYLPERLGGGVVRERLEGHDPVNRSYAYRMVDNGPLPWTGYEGRITVTPSGPDRAAILFEIRMTPIGVRGEEVVAISLDNINRYVASLRAATEK